MQDHTSQPSKLWMQIRSNFWHCNAHAKRVLVLFLFLNENECQNHVPRANTKFKSKNINPKFKSYLLMLVPPQH